MTRSIENRRAAMKKVSKYGRRPSLPTSGIARKTTRAPRRTGVILYARCIVLGSCAPVDGNGGSSSPPLSVNPWNRLTARTAGNEAATTMSWAISRSHVRREIESPHNLGSVVVELHKWEQFPARRESVSKV